MKLVEVQDLQQWDHMIQQSAGSFLQYSKWGEFERGLGLDIYYLGLEDKKGLRLGARVTVKRIIGGYNIMYATRLSIHSDVELQQEFFKMLRKWAQTKNIIFFKYDVENVYAEVKTTFGRKILDSISPEYSFLLDLGLSEDELLAQMHKKTRYNIRLAQRKGVKVAIYNDTQGVEAFIRLMKETSHRDGFASHSADYYKCLMQSGLVDVYLASVDNEFIAGALIHHTNQQSIYLHGASSYKHRALMAPYLVQWQAIRDAKEVGHVSYDFWGVQGGSLKASWAGFTRFKHGFNEHGVDVRYGGAYILIYNRIITKLYFVYRWLRSSLHRFLKR